MFGLTSIYLIVDIVLTFDQKLSKQQINQTKQNYQQINESWVLHDYWFASPTHPTQPKLFFQPQSNVGLHRTT